MGNFNRLPTEIVLEILSRAPAESVLECRRVSKPWRNLLQDLSFSQIHLNRLNDVGSGQSSLLFYTQISGDTNTFYHVEYSEKLSQFSRTRRINLTLPFQDYNILGSCNGLICFNAYLNGYYQPACVCNPITREYVVLSNFETTDLLYGFGYSSLTNEYKVVRIRRCKKDPNYGVMQVYTLGSGTGWRKGRKTRSKKRKGRKMDWMSFRQCGVFANGAIHWVDHKGTIVAFDLSDEEFRKIPSPPCTPGLELHALGDFLCARCHYAGGCDIWVLKKNPSNHEVVWSKEFTTVFDDRPVTFTKNGELLSYSSRVNRANKVYRYAPIDSYSRILVKFGDNFSKGIPHKNTFVSLKTLGEEDTKLMDSGERARSSLEKAIINWSINWSMRKKEFCR